MIFRPSANSLAALCVAFCLPALYVVPAFAQKAKPINAGEVLSGELTAMKSKRVKGLTFQLTTEPRRLPSPSGLCNLENGPETFQIVTSSESEAAALKPFIGKTVSVKANELSCAQEAGQMTDALVTKWSVVETR